jgi:hypothetical protein
VRNVDVDIAAGWRRIYDGCDLVEVQPDDRPLRSALQELFCGAEVLLIPHVVKEKRAPTVESAAGRERRRFEPSRGEFQYRIDLLPRDVELAPGTGATAS